ncbi:MAG: response regulator [Gammaproteobacteria bacterium]
MTKPNILFVDDEAAVLRAMSRIFRKADVNVLTANSAAEGLDVLRQHTVSVIISDQRMPGMCGTDFLKEVRSDYPDTVRCILSGYAEMESVVAAINDGHVYRFMAKPWDDDEIRKAIADCLRTAQGLAQERQKQISLQKKASALEDKSAQLTELFDLQESLLQSSRVVLDQLPVGVAAIDAQGRMIYTNRLFANEFGHLPGVALGQTAGEPWVGAANDKITGQTKLTVNQTSRLAQINRVEIGGQVHTLIAMSPTHT